MLTSRLLQIDSGNHSHTLSTFEIVRFIRLRMGYSRRYLPWFALLVLVYEGISSDFCRNNAIEIERSHRFTSLANFLNATFNYSNDPCEDFYQFACGRWMTEIEEPAWKMAGGEFTDNMDKMIAFLEAFFLSEEVSGSKSVNAMKEVYKSCMSSDDDWKSDGGAIKFVLARIEFSTAYNFPYSEPNVISYGNSTSVDRGFEELLFKVALKVCREFRAKCNESSIHQSVNEILPFVTKVNELEPYFSPKDKERWLHLSELNEKLSSVNWTKYFIMTAPPDTHSYFLADPLVHVPSIEYMEQLNEILQNTPKRILANFVILHYILSWAKYLDDDYRTPLKHYLEDIGVKNYPTKSTSCILVTIKMFDAAFTSVYGRKFNGIATEKMIEGFIREILAVFKEGIKENKWMTSEQKKSAILKAERMKIYAAYEDVHLNDSELDNRHKDLIELQHQRFLEVLDQYDHLQSISLFRRLLYFNVAEAFVPSLLVSKQEFKGPSYFPYLNTMVIPITFLHEPLFHSAYPISYNYGSIGSIIAHELMHGFDNHGIRLDENGEQRTLDSNDWLEFTKGLTCLEEQYNNSTILGSKLKVNGVNTLDENIADTEGVKHSFMAYRKYQKEKGHQGRLLTMEDITADQLFFLGWAVNFCEKYYEEDLTWTILLDPHAPSILRVNNVVSNTEGFADAFRCPPSSPMNPKNRCSIF
ncbi:hypothetical protein RB195_016598 [Necator americanus]|uniref:Peptidase family M13 n=1 Tax=Necator americanus TaxID=51031 RepID=A0ABR1C4Y9_NECAM